MSGWESVDRRNHIQTQALNKEVESAIDDKINSEMVELEARLNENINKGFLNNNPEEHRAYHEKLMIRDQKIEKLKEKVIEKVVASIIWAAIVGIAYLIDNWHTTLHR